MDSFLCERELCVQFVYRSYATGLLQELQGFSSNNNKNLKLAVTKCQYMIAG